jgi:radical SAM-linked protein
MKYLLRFKKYSCLSYISHNDIARTVEMFMRRSGCPMDYSQGFHPMPLISYSPAIPLGFINRAVYLTVQTKDYFDFSKVSGNIQKGLDLLEYMETPTSFKLSAEIEGYRFKCYLSENVFKKLISYENSTIEKGKNTYEFKKLFVDFTYSVNKKGFFMIQYIQESDMLFNPFKLVKDGFEPEKDFFIPICDKAVWRAEYEKNTGC